MNPNISAARWEAGWHLGLSPDVKLVYAYLLDHCNETGFWQGYHRDIIDSVGKEINWKQVALELDDRLRFLPNDVWWLSRYIIDRYGWLDRKNPDHEILFDQIRAAGVDLPCVYIPVARPAKQKKPKVKLIKVEPPKLIDAGKLGLPRPSAGLTLELEGGEPTTAEPQGVRILRVKHKRYDPANEPLPVLLNTTAFKSAWMDWIIFREEKKSSITESTARLQLFKLATMGEEIAILCIHRSIEQGWKGLFALAPKELEQARADRDAALIAKAPPPSSADTLPENVRQYLESQRKTPS